MNILFCLKSNILKIFISQKLRSPPIYILIVYFEIKTFNLRFCPKLINISVLESANLVFPGNLSVPVYRMAGSERLVIYWSLVSILGRPYLLCICAYTCTIWLSLLDKLHVPAVNPDWSHTLNYILTVSFTSLDFTLLRLCFQDSVYLLQRERNSRIHQIGFMSTS